MNNFTKIAEFGTNGTGNAQLNSPVDVATDGRFMYIADAGNSRVLKWWLQGGKFEKKISNLTASQLQCLNDDLIVLDSANSKIIKYDAQDLSKKAESDVISNMTSFQFWRDYIWVATSISGSVYKLNYNSLEIEQTMTKAEFGYTLYGYLRDESGEFITDHNGEKIWTKNRVDLDGITCLKGFIYILNGLQIFRLESDLSEVDMQADLSSYMDDLGYLYSHGDYLLIGSTGDKYVVVDSSLQVIKAGTFADESDVWSSFTGMTTLYEDYMLICDKTEHKIKLLYGIDRAAGIESGDALVVDHDELQWDEELTIASSESNLSTAVYEKQSPNKRGSRWRWELE